MTSEHTRDDLKALAIRDIESVGQNRLDVVAGMLHPKLEFDGNFGPVPVKGPDGWLGALRRLSPILQRNEVCKVLAQGNEVCILYDFVTPICPFSAPNGSRSVATRLPRSTCCSIALAGPRSCKSCSAGNRPDILPAVLF